MWGNLAGRLGATDINATLEKIGNAVAPREGDDDDEYYDDDDDVSDDDYDDDYNEDYDDDNGPGLMNKVAGASPFRLAGMLTQALDKRHVGMEDEQEDYDYSHKDENTDAGNKTLFPSESVRTENKIEPNVGAKDAGNGSHLVDSKLIQTALQQADKPVQLPSQVPVTPQYQISDTVQNETSTQQISTEMDSLSNVDIKDEVAALESVKAEGEKKLSPSTTTEMVDSITMNEVSSSTKSLSRRSGMVKADKEITMSKKPVESNKSQVLPKKVLEVDSSNNTPSKMMGEKGQNKIRNDGAKEGNEVIVEAAAKLLQVDDGAKEKNRTRVARDDIDATTKIITKASKPKLIKPNEKKAMSDLSRKKSPDNVVGRDGSGGDIEKTVEASATDKDTLIHKAAQPVPLSNKNTPPLTDTSLDDSKVLHSKEETNTEPLKAERSCQELETQLQAAKQEIEALRNQARRDKEKAKSEREDLISQFHSKETRLLQATSEENQNQTLLLEQEYSAKIQNLQDSLLNERKASQEEQAEYKRLLRESYSNVDRMEKQLKNVVDKHEMEVTQVQQREERALRKVDDRMAQTMAVLDERDEEIKKLKKSIKTMQSKVNEHQEGEEEAEEELEELHQENDSLRETIEKLELEKNNFKDQVAKLKSGSEELPGLQMELTMLKEERNRERTKNQAVMDSAISSRTQLETERDNTFSELRDLKQQLVATVGDLEVSRADYSRILMANENLQSALEAFQDERQAEMEMVDEQRRESEEAIKSAHATATNAMKQIHENELYEIQKASDNAVKNVMHEMELVEGNLEKLKSENNQMRRSLDEAIHRLQTTQEDVIDRNVMKNILLDWCTLDDKTKRHQVLEVMANLLHFSEEEKEKVHLTSKSLDSVRAKVVGALAAPLPPSKADVEHLEGSNVHEKWVNFLMAETDDA